MMRFTKSQIEALPHLQKINLINSVGGYKSANLIGSKSKNGITNLAVFSSVTHYGSSPAILGFVVRPTTVLRNTYENLKETGFYTINSIFGSTLEDAHHTSAKYPKEISEFDVTSFSELYLEDFYAPYVKNAPIQLGMKFLEEYHIKANNTILVLGEIQNINIQEALVEKDLFVNLSHGNIAAINGLDGYTVPESTERFTYQRPK
ncbi:flavin reductase family protein [Flavicella marina]|uniref:flavin reductase family protein n=1 Tax=Flavicella marina TaxID=1475951 RepID=UPI0012646E95|nr:flavin reductase [Flavicella marina]